MYLKHYIHHEIYTFQTFDHNYIAYDKYGKNRTEISHLKSLWVTECKIYFFLALEMWWVEEHSKLVSDFVSISHLFWRSVLVGFFWCTLNKQQLSSAQSRAQQCGCVRTRTCTPELISSALSIRLHNQACTKIKLLLTNKHFILWTLRPDIFLFRVADFLQDFFDKV